MLEISTPDKFQIIGVIAALLFSVIALIISIIDRKSQAKDIKTAFTHADALTKANTDTANELKALVQKTNDHVEAANKNLQLQTESLQQSRKQFELLSKPLLQVTINENNIESIEGWPIKVTFKIRNLGKMPAEIKFGKFTFFYQANKYFRTQVVDNLMGLEPQLLNLVIVEETQEFTKSIGAETWDSEQKLNFTKHKEEDLQSCYLAGRFHYVNYALEILGDRQTYFFICKIRYNEIEFVYNKNFISNDGSLPDDFIDEIRKTLNDDNV